MQASNRTANVCSGLPVAFYWLGCQGETESDHIQAATDALFRAIERPGERGWTPWNKPLVTGSFRRRIEKAARGELRPRIDLEPGQPPLDRGEFRRVGDGRLPLYEIFWSDIDVHEFDEGEGPAWYRKIQVRMIFGEPIELSRSALGLHAHEKALGGTADDIKHAQDAEIAEATRLYMEHAPAGWGVKARTSR